MIKNDVVRLGDDIPSRQIWFKNQYSIDENIYEKMTFLTYVLRSSTKFLERNFNLTQENQGSIPSSG